MARLRGIDAFYCKHTRFCGNGMQMEFFRAVILRPPLFVFKNIINETPLKIKDNLLFAARGLRPPQDGDCGEDTHFS